MIRLGLLLALVPAQAFAQARQCDVPATLPRPAPDGPTASQPKRTLPIGGYTLALSWSPEYCKTRRSDTRDSFQCGGARPRFGFTLHGLWPDGRGATWPQYCRPARLLPAAVLKRNLCVTPSVQLQQHEWAKHGTCMTSDPQRYFERANRLYRDVRYPDMDALSRRPLTVARFAQAFAAANPGVRPNMLRVTADRAGWLDEVWLCLGTDFRPRACRASTSGAAAATRLQIWRGGR